MKTPNTNKMIVQPNTYNIKTPVIMKTKSLPKALIIFICLASMRLSAQNYNFSLENNGNYGFTISAESLFDSATFMPITQSYGFVIVVPDGVTITIDQVLPLGTAHTVTEIQGSNVSAIDASMADKDLFLVVTDTAGRTISAHPNASVIPLVAITVNGNPTSGEIRILDNASVLASSAAINGALDAFFQVDIIDDSTTAFTNEYNMIGTNPAWSFNALSIDQSTPLENSVILYPNPARDKLNIKAYGPSIESVEIFDTNGKLVGNTHYSGNAIDIGMLDAATYMVLIKTDRGKLTKKLVKD